MARLEPRPAREDLPENERHFYDEIIARRGELSPPTLYFMNSPALASAYALLADTVRLEGVLSPGQVRLAGMIVGREFDCNFIWAVNEPFAAQTGPSAAGVDAIRNRTSFDSLPERESVIANYVAELLRTRHVSDGAFKAAEAQLGTRGVLELNAVVSLYTMIANMVNGFEIEPPPGSSVLH